MGVVSRQIAAQVDPGATARVGRLLGQLVLDRHGEDAHCQDVQPRRAIREPLPHGFFRPTMEVFEQEHAEELLDRKSTRLNSSHSQISYAVFCLKKKKKTKKKHNKQ